MSIERTLCIIKPEAVRENLIGKIFAQIEGAGLRILGMRMVRLTENQAREFYAVHKERPFYKSLVKYMTSGPVVVACLEGENAIAKYRGVMGATDPAKADEGTIRREYGKTIESNAVHGSDAPATAKTEVGFFFKEQDIFLWT